MKAIAVISCYNEAHYIKNVVLQTNQFVDMTIVVDDDSTDDSVAKAKEAGAYVVRRFGKRGAGMVFQDGVKVALLKDCDVIVTLDGDGQHDPMEIPELIMPIERGEADVVLGSRFLQGKNAIPRYRKFGIKVITWLYNVFVKHKITDAQCGLRAYHAEVLKSLQINESGFAFSTETLIKVRVLSFKITEVPVKVIYHGKLSQNSTLNPIRHGVSVAWATVRLRLELELWGKVKRVILKG